jgi:hypothetical protein
MHLKRPFYGFAFNDQLSLKYLWFEFRDGAPATAVSQSYLRVPTTTALALTRPPVISNSNIQIARAAHMREDTTRDKFNEHLHDPLDWGLVQ